MPLNQQARDLVWTPHRNAGCRQCPLWEEAQTVCLMGDGPVPAEVMIVGEAPGYREDEISRPFSGAAGQLLDRTLREVGLARDSIFITNTNKCRPPDNRTPTKTEIKACRPYLDRELEVVNPRIVLLMGNTALQGSLNQSGIMSKRGTTVEHNGRTYLLTVHPAAVLRNPALEQDFLADFRALARLVKGEDKKPETKSFLITSTKGFQKFTNLLAGVQTPIAFDLETRGPEPEGGLRPWQPGGLIDTAAFCWDPGTSYVLALEHPDARWDVPVSRVYEALNVALQNKKLVGHNVKFDLSWLRAKDVFVRAHFDTYLAAQLLDENRANRLKNLARTYLGADLYEAGVRFTSEAADLRTLAIYNGKDADYTLRLYHLFRDQLKAERRLLRLFVLLTMPACNEFVEIESRGFPVDIPRLKERHNELVDRIRTTEDEIIQRWVPESLRATRPNFRSPLFLASWLFGEQSLRLPILEISAKSKRPSTREGVLLQLKHPAVSRLMELRKWYKYESTYTRNWIARVQSAKKPRLYTTYNLGGTVTGRLSSDMQQVPRDLYIRGILGFSKPGWRLIEADFSQVELRIAAMLSGDPELNRAFNTGQDPHRQTAVAITGKPADQITSEERKLAKSVNFGFLYGMGAKKFVTYCFDKYGIEITLEEAQAFRNAFFTRYEGLPKWHARQRRLVQDRGYVSSPTGRVRHLPTINSADEGIVAEAERQAINSPVQGLASDFTVLAMALLNQKLDNRTARVLGNLHDAIVLEAREEVADDVAKVVKATMEGLPLSRLFGFRPSVPIEVDVKIGTHWGEK